MSVVIPTYNGEEGLESLLSALIPLLESLNRRWEVYFVDDHGSDGSFDLIRQFHQHDSRIRGCRLAENRGQQNALFCGLVLCEGEVVITMDDDLQHPVDRIPQLIEHLEEGPVPQDLVYCVTRNPRRPLILRLGTDMTDLFFRLFTGKPGQVEVGSYRILRRSVVDRIRECKGSFVYVSAMIFRSCPGLKVSSFRYDSSGPAAGTRTGTRFSLLSRIRVFGNLFHAYGPFRWLTGNQDDPFRVEAEL